MQSWAHRQAAAPAPAPKLLPKLQLGNPNPREAFPKGGFNGVAVRAHDNPQKCARMVGRAYARAGGLRMSTLTPALSERERG